MMVMKLLLLPSREHKPANERPVLEPLIVSSLAACPTSICFARNCATFWS